MTNLLSNTLSTKAIVPPSLLCDFYKTSHKGAYPKGTTKIYSTFTPRTNKYMPMATGAVVFGIQSFIMKYFIEYFNVHFFGRSKEVVVAEYRRYMKHSLLIENPDSSHIAELHDLGYLPLQLKALKEGTVAPIQTPVLTLENTHDDFYWLTNYFETIMSNEIWLPMTSATFAYEMRKLLNEFAVKTTGSTDGVEFQCHDFSMRGMSSLESAMASGAGHLLSFVGTDTIPAIAFLEHYYGADIEKEVVGTSIPACYDDKTEILTENGWKLFKDLVEGEKVAQYHENGDIDFVVPSEYYNMPYKGKMITFTSKEKGNPNYVDFCVTPNHRMVRRKISDKTLQIFEAGSEKYHERTGYSSKNLVVVSGNAKNENLALTDLEKLRIAFQADGSHMSHDKDYTGEKTGAIPVRFSLKKDRKKDRLVSILESLGYEYTLNKYEDGYYSFYVKIPLNISLVKDFSWVNLSEISSEWGNEFIEELKYWDGSQKSENTISYSSTIQLNTEVVQSIATLSGNKAMISSYSDKRADYDREVIHTVSIFMNKEEIGGRIVTKGEVEYNSTVHCVSVPTKMLIVRRNGVVGISGNTEHSVMTALTPTDGSRDERDAFKHLITEVFPSGFVSLVSDSYDFWKVVEETIPSLKEEIMNRDGRTVFRPDSGNPADILCGRINYDVDFTEDFTGDIKDLEDYIYEVASDWAREACEGRHNCGNESYDVRFKVGDKIYSVEVGFSYNRHDKTYYYIDRQGYKSEGVQWDQLEELEVTAEDKGLIECLWDTFGGTVTEQGYKVLDSHVGAIYGDSITYDLAKEICKRLGAKGFASTNVVFGVGSYSYQGRTRDSLGWAMKATYAEIDGKPVMLMKDPKTDSKKKSQRGQVHVFSNNGKIEFVDGLSNNNTTVKTINLLEPVFKDGVLLREETLAEIRGRLNK